MNQISMISKTKKKSFNDYVWLAAASIPFFGLLAIMSFLVRVITLQGTYGSVGGVIPVVSHNIEDPAFHRFKETPNELIDARTVTVAITEKALFFGELKYFNSQLSDPSKRFRIDHIDGSPQIGQLITQLDTWSKSRRQNENIPKDPLLVLLPTTKLPMPILIQIMAALKNTNTYPNIVLGTGII